MSASRPANEVQQRIHEDPHHINEMPVQAGQFYVLAPRAAAPAQYSHYVIVASHG
jgi:hypothetical protein